MCSPLGQNKKCGGKSEERLIWKIPSARSFTYFHRASRLLWRLSGLEASASVGLLTWLVASKCKGVLLWGLSSWVQHETMHRVGSDPTVSECLVQGYACMKNTSCSLLVGQGITGLAQCGCWVLLPQKGSPQLTLPIGGCSEE